MRAEWSKKMRRDDRKPASPLASARRHHTAGQTYSISVKAQNCIFAVSRKVRPRPVSPEKPLMLDEAGV
jgi:hypothetical protein